MFFSQLGVKVRVVTADAPKRAELKKTQGHMSYMACDYCLACGTGLFTLRGGHKISWPYAKDTGRPRTHAATLRIANWIERNGYPKNFQTYSREDKAEFCGIKGKSHLFSLPGFDIIKDVPMEGMHLLQEGFTSLVLG